MTAQTNSLNLGEQLLERKSVRLAAIALMLSLLSACGSEMTTRSNAFASTSGPTTSTSIISGQANAECSSFASTSSTLGGKVTTYYKNSVLQEDKLRVRITSLVAAFDTNSNYYIQAFRWKVQDSGTAYIDQTPVQFQFEKGTGSDTPMTALVSSVSLTGISAYRTANVLGGTGALDFFSKTTMVMTGVDYTWQALKLVVYDGSTSPATVVAQTDILLPAFQVDPNVYAATHSSILAPLHPFYAQRSQTSTNWAQSVASYCF